MHETHPLEITFPPDPDELDRIPRCIACGYRLQGLGNAQCPECGRTFDPFRPSTYLRQQPYIWYRYWWPGILLSVGVGLAWAIFFYNFGALGWGLFLGLPWMMGALLGYRDQRSGGIGTVIGSGVLLTCILLLIIALFGGGLAGLFCSIIMLPILLPIGMVGLLFGIFCARLLANVLKQTAFSQGEYLPMLLVILLLPGGAHVMQLLFAKPIPTQTIQTSRVVAMDQGRAWDAWMFYEEVNHEPPLLLRLGLPRPSHVEGRIQQVGDREVCVYTGDARLVKRATAVVPGELLAFDVIEQHHFENHSMRLIDGRFEFIPQEAGSTQVILTTRYEPLLRPRFIWQSIENTVAHQLHDHVLGGMEGHGENAQYTQHQGGAR